MRIHHLIGKKDRAPRDAVFLRRLSNAVSVLGARTYQFINISL